MRNNLAIEMATDTAKAYIGTLYKWAGDDPSGYDCSGLVVECLRSAGIIGQKSDYTANGLLKLFAKNDRGDKKALVHEGFLIFRLNQTGKAVHVEYCLNTSFTIGASGGGSRIRMMKAELDSVHETLEKINPTGGTFNAILADMMARHTEERRAITDNAFVKINPIDRDENIKFVDPFYIHTERFDIGHNKNERSQRQ